MKLLVMQSSPLPCYLIPLGPKYPPQHSILENPQPTFLPQCELPSFTPIQNILLCNSRVFCVPRNLNHTAWPQNLKRKWRFSLFATGCMSVHGIHIVASDATAQRGPWPTHDRGF
jgi:hypothetical protein